MGSPFLVSPLLLSQLLVLALRRWPRWQWQLAWLARTPIPQHQPLGKVNVALAVKGQLAVGSPMASGIRANVVTVPEAVTAVTSTVSVQWQICTGPQDRQLLCHSWIYLLGGHTWLPCFLSSGTHQLQARPQVLWLHPERGLVCTQSPCWSYYWLI